MVKEFPDFFKVFLTKKDYERMLIPNAFVNLLHLKKMVRPDFVLRNHSGRDWHVKLLSIGHEVYFDDGWKRFKEENSLEDNDYIVFTHIENNVFKFKILELSSMCEKEKKNDEKEKNTMVNGESENEHQHCRACNPCKFSYVTEIKRTFCLFCMSENLLVDLFVLGCIGSRSEASELEDVEIDEEMYVQQGNPYFLTKYIYYRRNELYIPKNVIKDLCLCFTKYITLVCCHCKDVETNEIAAYHHILPQTNAKHIEKRGRIRTWRDGRVFVQGWEDFCRKSKITEKDICLCELVLHEDGTVEMLRVHVVNVRKE
ncbi:unnamed protein product [Lathyrus sativus]|nr:unnamed protein product [Lathyrus sativus]